MDPNACLDRAESALRDNDREGCESALDDYNDWRARGGFAPPDGDERAKRIAKSAEKWEA